VFLGGGHGVPSFVLEQHSKSGLPKVMISRKGFDNFKFMHHCERNAINQRSVTASIVMLKSNFVMIKNPNRTRMVTVTLIQKCDEERGIGKRQAHRFECPYK